MKATDEENVAFLKSLSTIEQLTIWASKGQEPFPTALPFLNWQLLDVCDCQVFHYAAKCANLDLELLILLNFLNYF